MDLRSTLATQNFSIQKVMACLYHEHEKSFEQIQSIFEIGATTAAKNINSWKGLSDSQKAKAREGAKIVLSFEMNYDDSDRFSDLN